MSRTDTSDDKERYRTAINSREASPDNYFAQARSFFREKLLSKLASSNKPSSNLSIEEKERLLNLKVQVQERSQILIAKAKKEALEIDSKAEPAQIFSVRRNDNKLSEVDLLNAALNVYGELYEFGLEYFADDEGFWQAFNLYLEKLGMGHGAAIFSDQEIIAKVIDRFEDSLEIKRAFIINIFKKSGVTELILKSKKIASLKEPLRSLLIKNLLEQNLEFAELALNYFEQLDEKHLNSERRIIALIDFCSMEKAKSNKPDIGLFWQFVERRENNNFPYR